jgi:hypothetical protein
MALESQKNIKIEPIKFDLNLIPKPSGDENANRGNATGAGRKNTLRTGNLQSKKFKRNELGLENSKDLFASNNLFSVQKGSKTQNHTSSAILPKTPRWK